MAKEDDSVTLIKVIDTVARAKGMTKIAKEAGISREGLYKSLSPNDNPSFAIICKILNAIRLHSCSYTYCKENRNLTLSS